MKLPVNILHLEDNPDDAGAVDAALTRASHLLPTVVKRVATRADYRTVLVSGGFDIILSGSRLADIDGDDALSEALTHCPGVPFILVTPELDEERAIEVLKRGAADYIQKDDMARLVPAITRALGEAERRQTLEAAQGALQESEARYRSVFQESHAVMLLVNPETGKIIDANPAAVLFYGWPLRELTSKRMTEINVADPATIRTALAAAATRKQTFFQFKHRTRRGDVRDVAVYTGPIVLNGRRTLFSIIHDVTEGVQARERLRESNELMRAIVQNSPFGAHTYRLEPDGRLVFTEANPAAGTILGVDHQQFLGKTIEEAFPGLRTTEIPELYRTTARTGAPFTREQLTYDQGGINGAFELHGFRTGNDQMTVFFIDVTEQARARDAVRRANEELEHRVQERTRQLETLNKELEAFSYSVSHDLKAPLRIISGFARLLSQSSETLTEHQRESLEFIRLHAGRMDALINALLDFSRVSRKQPERTQINTRSLVEEVLEDMRRAVGADAASRVCVEIGDLPVVLADPLLLRQVFTNLISNAFKFTRTVEKPVVRITAERTNDRYRFSISDNGVGFPRAHAAKLFGVFHRLHPQDEYEGTGVGLANVRKIIEHHGGEVSAEGEEGKGATFIFTLPVE